MKEDLIMRFKNKLEKIAIPKLPLILVALFVFGYILTIFGNSSKALMALYEGCLFIPEKIIDEHQYWRLISWLITNPFDISRPINMILAPVTLFFYYWIGINLERVWGRGMFNLYVLGSVLLVDVFGVLSSLIVTGFRSVYDYALLYLKGEITSIDPALMTNVGITYYIMLSMFLAFAILAPDVTVLLYFIIPVKIKWLAYLDLGLLLYEFINIDSWIYRSVIFASVLNYFIFWYINRKKKGKDLGSFIRRKKFQNKTNGNRKDFSFMDKSWEELYGKRKAASSNKITYRTKNAIHECAVCHRTELDDPDLEFRYCSKCNGNYEYCSDHLYTHEHKQ